MPQYRPGEKVKAILRAAASTPEFLDMLLREREKALARMGLSPEEKAALTSLSAEELKGLVRRDRSARGPWRALTSRVLLLAAVIALLIVVAWVTTDEEAKRAAATLIQLSIAEGVYEQEHGVYADMDSLLASDVVKNEPLKSELRSGASYEYGIELDGGTFTATARHRTSPHSRPAFRVGPEGEVERLE